MSSLSYKQRQRLYLDNYKSLGKLLSKTLLLFGLTAIGLLCVYDGDTQFDTPSNSKIQMVARWKRAAAASPFPYTSFQNTSTKTGSAFWKSIHPSFECPKRLLTKVGDVGDAGKWICGMQTLGRLSKNSEGAPPCSVYSTGSKQNSFFEVEILALTNCTIYAYEPSSAIVDHPLSYFEERVNLESVMIGGQDKGCLRTLKSLMKKNDNQKWVDIVKLDVGEWDIETLERILQDFDGEELPIGQLIVRLNVANWKDDRKIRDRIISVFEGLEGRGLRMFHKEINPYFQENIADFSFVNSEALRLFLGKNDLKKYEM